ncbi:MAG: hypothetical protein IPL33_14490 [Sphingobacteriales bacterium]|nr:hypothetical protein [Sphingobacteriales bacterium]
MPFLPEILPHSHDGIYTSASGYRPKPLHRYHFSNIQNGYGLVAAYHANHRLLTF